VGDVIALLLIAGGMAFSWLYALAIEKGMGQP
jgi:hypothetical protein